MVRDRMEASQFGATAASAETIQSVSVAAFCALPAVARDLKGLDKLEDLVCELCL